jgi:hypothetical protein
LKNNFFINIRAFGDKSAYNEYTRFLPKQIFYDKEKLYEDSLKIKNTINEISAENIQLKNKIQTLSVLNFIRKKQLKIKNK